MATKKPADKAAPAETKKPAAAEKTKAPKAAAAAGAKSDVVGSATKKEAAKAVKVHHEHKDRAKQHCKMKSCKREYRAKGYCRVHYKKWRRGEYGLARYKTCGDKAGCRKPMAMNRQGFCEEHFQNYFVKGVEMAQAAPAEKAAEKTAAA